MPAMRLRSIESWPSCGPTVRLETTSSGTARRARLELDDKILNLLLAHSRDDALIEYRAINRRRRITWLSTTIDMYWPKWLLVSRKLFGRSTFEFESHDDSAKVVCCGIGILQIFTADDCFVDSSFRSWRSGCLWRGTWRGLREPSGEPTGEAPGDARAYLQLPLGFGPGPSVVETIVPGGMYCPWGSMISSNAVSLRTAMAASGSSMPGSSTMI